MKMFQKQMYGEAKNKGLSKEEDIVALVKEIRKENEVELRD